MKKICSCNDLINVLQSLIGTSDYDIFIEPKGETIDSIQLITENNCNNVGKYVLIKTN